MASPNFFKSNTGFPDSVRLTVASAINSLKYLTGYRQRKQSGWGYWGYESINTMYSMECKPTPQETITYTARCL